MERIWRLRCSPRWKHLPQPSTWQMYNRVSFWSVGVRLNSWVLAWVGTRRPLLFFVKLGIGVGSVARERGRRGSCSCRSSDTGEACQNVIWCALAGSLEDALTDPSEGWRVTGGLGLGEEELLVRSSTCSTATSKGFFGFFRLVVAFLGATLKWASSGVRRFSTIPVCKRVCGRLGVEHVGRREVFPSSVESTLCLNTSNIWEPERARDYTDTYLCLPQSDSIGLGVVHSSLRLHNILRAHRTWRRNWTKQ